ncbi:MAG: MFS transporter [Nannocystaceae bacterium]
MRDRTPRTPAGVWTSTTMFAEGLPWTLLHQVTAEFFTAVGLPARQVGYTSALHLTGSLKFLWSPLVDLFGTLRSWMIATQALMGAVVGVLAVHADALARASELSTATIWALLTLIGVLSATHDIACDGYYMDALDRDDQARYAGLRIAGFRVAMFVGSAGLVYVGGRFGWLAGFGAGAALLMALAAFHRLALAPGRSEARRHARDPSDMSKPWAARARHVAGAYLSFLLQPRAAVVLLFIATFKLGDALIFSMSKVLLRDLGIATTSRALVNGVAVSAMISGAVLGGAWIARRGLATTIVPIALLMAMTEPLMILLAAEAVPRTLAAHVPGAPWAVDVAAPASLAAAAVIMAIEQFAGGMATAAQMVFLMRRCHPDHKAAHYAFATAVYLFAQTASGTYSGHLYEGYGPILFFAVTSVACIPCLALVTAIPTEPRDAASVEPAR